MVERVPSGIPGLDKQIEGGVPKGSINLVVGTLGAGKSILCAQILYNSALQGKKCLYLNLEQNEGRLESQMKQFGWDLNKVKNTFKIVAIDSSNPEMVEVALAKIQETNYDLIAVDSLDSIASSNAESEVSGKMSIAKIAETVVPTILDVATIGRMKLKKIFNAIANTKATAFLTSEKVEGAEGISRDTISEFLCDSIIILTLHKALDTRKLEIAKMRNTVHTLKPQTIEITKQGIKLK